MKQSCVSAFARAARSFALAAVALGLGAGSLLAQGSTGKIEGRVRDQAGAPIANAQVFIVGTAFNALTNPQGYYFINNVPAGTYSVRAAFIGYKSTQVDGVKVLAGQTITVDIQLEQTAVQIQEITVVTQTQPLVPRDEVTTKQRIDGEFTSNLPVDRLNNVLALQPGVVGQPHATTRISIRGGRTDEAVTYIDGVPVSPGYRGGSNVGSLGTEISVGTNALEEASVTTGSSSAEFGNAQSGVISIADQDRRQQATPAASATRPTSPSARTPASASTGFQGSFGGPITRNLTFFVSGALEGQQVGRDRLRRPGLPASSCRPASTPWWRSPPRSAIRRPTPPWFRCTTTPPTGATATTSPAAPIPTSPATTAWTARASGRRTRAGPPIRSTAS